MNRIIFGSNDAGKYLFPRNFFSQREERMKGKKNKHSVLFISLRKSYIVCRFFFKSGLVWGFFQECVCVCVCVGGKGGGGGGGGRKMVTVPLLLLLPSSYLISFTIFPPQPFYPLYKSPNSHLHPLPPLLSLRLAPDLKGAPPVKEWGDFSLSFSKK